VHCDGQGLVSADMIGLFDRFTPKFAKRYADVGGQILKVFQQYREEVLAGTFPDAEHSYHMSAAELANLQKGQS
jgi:3-methyl-2-oxobutanoate hydroxymethyltransferase